LVTPLFVLIVFSHLLPGQLSMLGSQLMRGVAASERIFEVIDTIAPINSGGGYALDHIIGMA
jgi:hypothetical protein